MKEHNIYHKALLQAQEKVRPPRYNKDKGMWTVTHWEDSNKIVEEFTTEEAAYAFFYKKLNEFKEFYIKQLRIPFERTK